VNQTADIGGGTFTDPNFNPAPYFIDIDTNTVHTVRQPTDDIRVDIGPVDGAGLRSINATGLDLS
jgi:hypothetical protein